MMVALPILLASMTGLYYYQNRFLVSTDNAYIRQEKVSISPEIGGRIIEINVRENQRVKAGDLLFRIDPQPYLLSLAEAEAELASARAKLEALQVAYETSTVEIDSAQEDIAYFSKEYQRQIALTKTSITTESSLQAAEHALSEANSRLAQAKANAAKAEAALSVGGSSTGVHPDLLAAQAQLKKAQLDLSRTEVTAPADGIVSQTSRLQKGQVMMSVLPALTIVRDDTSWVEANFKETDITHIRVGQPVTIEVDTYPDLVMSGHIESIGAGTGSEFSVLPTQNANANWVKVTQRVPIRIAIDTRLDFLLISGLSLQVTVNTND